MAGLSYCPRASPDDLLSYYFYFLSEPDFPTAKNDTWSWFRFCHKTLPPSVPEDLKGIGP